MSFRLSSPCREQPGTYRGSSRSARLLGESTAFFQRVRCFQTSRASSRTFLWWLVLSHIGTDVLDEWVFGFQGASGALFGLTPYIADEKRICCANSSKKFFQLLQDAGYLSCYCGAMDALLSRNLSGWPAFHIYFRQKAYLSIV